MSGSGKSPVWMAAVLALLGGVLLLIPGQAMAQFNIEGMIRGAMGGYHGGGGYYRSRSYHHSSRHEESRHEASRHSRHEKDDADETSDKGKEKDATKDEAASANTGSHGSASHEVVGAAPTAAPQQASGGGDSSASNSSPPSNSKSSDDQPSFAPAR